MNDLLNINFELFSTINNSKPINIIKNNKITNYQQEKRNKLNEILPQVLKAIEIGEKFEEEKNIKTSIHKHRHEKSRKKRSNDENERIEMVENDFFYRFNVKIQEYIRPGNGIFSKKYYDSKKFVLIKNWKKYASSWEEFEKKFSTIKFKNFEASIGGSVTKKLNEKIYNFDIKKINEKIKINDFSIKNFWNSQSGNLFFKIFVENEKLMLEISYDFNTVFSSEPWANFIIDSIQLVGEVDFNPLIKNVIDMSEEFSNLYSNNKKKIELFEQDPNFNPQILEIEKKIFNNTNTLWLLNIQNHYITTISIIKLENQIDELKKEINELKERLNNLQEGKSCLENFSNSVIKNQESKDNKFQKNYSDSTTQKLINSIVKSSIKSTISISSKGVISFVSSCLLETFNSNILKNKKTIIKLPKVKLALLEENKMLESYKKEILEKSNKKGILSAIRRKNKSASILTKSDFEFESNPSFTNAKIKILTTEFSDLQTTTELINATEFSDLQTTTELINATEFSDLQTTTELINATELNAMFIKSINFDQDLIIENKTNLITNNITSL